LAAHDCNDASQPASRLAHVADRKTLFL